ncbi:MULTISPECIES: iron ABC transporter permease [unclassified Beijerinckia]|uniref:ABC transporter permease n=1 Tax=unclassified Beijerinckia TaxID=2638183 RepID=UPI00089D68AA|nr:MULTISPECIES: iron ABC transporter permease [unclassified Beijerinckia]MDH7797659.1 iron(III) transport system permease protein [Beijerinckia sp. GAS462]SEC94036.1 iron(III) transport system permease protein [Beijerinckia sp. 28-YEA-48]
MTDNTAGTLRPAGASKPLVGPNSLAFRFSRYFTGRDAAVLTLVLILGFLAVYPLAMLFYGSLHSTPPGMAGEFNLDGYRSIFTSSNMVVLANTVGISLAKTIPALLMAVLLAWIVARTDTPYRDKLEVLITLPFFVPPILTAMAWGMLGNPQVGLLNQVWKWATGSSTSIINVYSYGGVVWHMVQYSTPFLFLFIVDIFRAMDPSLEESSRMCGASRWRTFRNITLMLMLPALTNSFILSFIRGIESFESPLFFGTPAKITVITTEIYNSINHRATPDYQYATALSFAIMALMFILVIWQWRLLRGRTFSTVTGKGYSPSVMKLGKWKWVTFGFCILFFFVTVVLPIGQLAIGSFFRFFGFYSRDMLTLEHYSAVFSNAEVWRAFGNTMFLGLIGATATMVLGSVVAYVSIRTRWRGRRLIDALAWLPWMMPGMVLGIGFLWAFAMLPGPIPIYGTIWALLLAYMALGTPVSVRVMTSAYAQLSYDLEECSRVHGASFFQTLWRILIALAWPSFAVGWVLAFFGIMRELSASILLYSVGSEVLSVVLLRLWSNGQAEQVSVIGLFMMLLVIVFRWAQLRFIKNRISTL